MSEKLTKVLFKKNSLEAAHEKIRALGHPLRLEILKYIDEYEPEQVKDIYEALNIQQVRASQHLWIMIDAWVVISKENSDDLRDRIMKINFQEIKKIVKVVDKFIGKKKVRKKVKK